MFFILSFLFIESLFIVSFLPKYIAYSSWDDVILLTNPLSDALAKAKVLSSSDSDCISLISDSQNMSSVFVISIYILRYPNLRIKILFLDSRVDISK